MHGDKATCGYTQWRWVGLRGLVLLSWTVVCTADSAFKTSSFRARVVLDACSAFSAVMTSDDRPIYSSANFAGSYSSTVIRLLPPLVGTTPESASSRCTLYAFSNRGYLLTATLRIDAEGDVEVERAEETVGEVKANDVEFVDFEDDEDGRKRRRAVVWERAGNRFVLLEQTEVRDRYLSLSPRVPRSSALSLAGFATTGGDGLLGARPISPFFTTDSHLLPFSPRLSRRQHPWTPLPLLRRHRLRLGNDLDWSP